MYTPGKIWTQPQDVHVYHSTVLSGNVKGRLDPGINTNTKLPGQSGASRRSPLFIGRSNAHQCTTGACTTPTHSSSSSSCNEHTPLQPKRMRWLTALSLTPWQTSLSRQGTSHTKTSVLSLKRPRRVKTRPSTTYFLASNTRFRIKTEP